jgi:HPt (histidine-containing phosphotransfer) domain-containing protein
LIETWLAQAKAGVATAPSSSTITGQAGFDESVLLDRLTGDRELVREIFTTFLLDLPNQIQALLTCANLGDVKGVARQAHSIRGASAAVGSQSLVDVAATIEQSVANEDFGALNASVAALPAEFARLESAIQASSIMAPNHVSTS